MAKFFKKITFKNKLLFFFLGVVSYLVASFANCFTYGIAKKSAEADSIVAYVIAICNSRTVRIAMYLFALILILFFYIRFFRFKRYKHKRFYAGAAIAIHLLYFAVVFVGTNLEVFTTVALITALFDIMFMASSVTTSLHSQIGALNTIIRVVSFFSAFAGVIIFLFVPLDFEPGIFEVLIMNFLVIAQYLLMCAYYLLPRRK